MLHRLLLALIVAILAVVLTGIVQAWAKDQLVIVLDASSSMTALAPYSEAGGRTRWDIAQEGLETWQRQFPHDLAVGAIAVGGDCTQPVSSSVPLGSSRNAIDRWRRGLSPGGSTPLNAALLELPAIFTNAGGQKRVLIVSDGLNTCPPARSTCDIVRELNRSHGIVFDVVAFLAEPGMEVEFRCIADSSGGRFRAPTKSSEWGVFPLELFDPWPYLILALGLATLLATTELAYSHLAHTLRRPPQEAAFLASAFCIVGGILVWSVLFLGQGLLAAMIAAVVAAATTVSLTRSPPERPVFFRKATGRRTNRW
jgi:hypothetical protein